MKKMAAKDRVLPGRERPMNESEGRVSCVYGAYYSLLEAPDFVLERRGRPRGRLRLAPIERAGFRLRHPIVVGDVIRFERPDESSEAWITAVDARRNVLCRGSGRELHALGANLDLALVVLSLADPPPRWGFADRFLASAWAEGIEAGLVLTKSDLPAAGEIDVNTMIEVYTRLEYPLFRLDARGGDAASRDELARLRSALAGRTTLLAGQSGAGKSTLLNSLAEQELQRVADISRSTGKGRHTTTNSFLRRVDQALIIDTPGVREWGVHHLDRLSIMHSYPELRVAAAHCEFQDCDHGSEARGCAVQALLQHSRDEALAFYDNPDTEDGEQLAALPPFQEGLVHPERYRSLAAMLSTHGLIDRIRTGDYIRATGRIRSGRLRDPNVGAD